MLKNFRTYHLAAHFYRLTCTLRLPRHLKEQLSRAASSVALNIAEGAGRQSAADQRRFYSIAFGSLRECQAILDLSARREVTEAVVLADVLAAHIYRLLESRRGR